jgi:tetratricopeptide (TPR) repeat protein
MTSRISKALVVVALLVSSFVAFAQEDLLNSIAQLKRMEAMYPDQVEPKYQRTLQTLNYAVMNPRDSRTEALLAEASQAITELESQLDASDLYTLKGFYYMDLIVKDPAQNGRLYYLDVMQYFEKALKLNPDNALAKDLQQKFLAGMTAAMH